MGGGVENFVDERDQRGDTFEREALAAEIALLHDLLEDVGADEQFEDALLVSFCNLECVGFHLLVDPAAAFRGVDVVNLDADSAGIDGAGFAGVFAFVLEFGRFAGTEEAEGVEVALEVSPLAVGGEDTFAFGIGAVGFCDGGAGAAVGSLGFRSHMSAVTRIKDAGESQKAQPMRPAERPVDHGGHRGPHFSQRTRETGHPD